MRQFAVFLTLALLMGSMTLAEAATADAPPTCTVGAPGYSATLDCPGNSCSNLGTTTMSVDKANIIACMLETGNSTVTACNAATAPCKWKAMSGGGDGASNTSYGFGGSYIYATGTNGGAAYCSGPNLYTKQCSCPSGYVARAALSNYITWPTAYSHVLYICTLYTAP